RSACELRQKERRLEVGIEGGVPVALGDFLERFAREDRSRVDEDVDSAERVEHVRDHLLDFGDVVEIGAEGPGLAAPPRDLSDNCVRLGVRAAIVNCDRSAVVGKVYRDRASDAAARASYQGNFSLEVHAGGLRDQINRRGYSRPAQLVSDA